MATLAIVGAGAAIGGIAGSAAGIGIATGVSIGIMAGQMAATYLIPPDQQTIEGPRLDELNVQTSTYGAGRPESWGSTRRAGNIIWATDLIEESYTIGGGKGKGMGGGGPTQRRYRYYGNFAVGFGYGPAQLVRRIWADNKVIYDRSDINSEGITNKYGPQRVRIYLGTEDQEPDPLIEQYEGTANTPAYRGEVYVVFDRLPLKDFGNRIPQIHVELTTKSSPTTSYNSDIIFGSPYCQAPGNACSYQFNGGGIISPLDNYLWETSNGGAELYKINRFTREVTAYRPFDDEDNLAFLDNIRTGMSQGISDAPIYDPVKNKVFLAASGASRNYLICADAETLKFESWVYIGLADTYDTYGVVYYPESALKNPVSLVTGNTPSYIVVAGWIRGPLRIIPMEGDQLNQFSFDNMVSCDDVPGLDEGHAHDLAIDLASYRAWACAGAGDQTNGNWIVELRENGTFGNTWDLGAETSYTGKISAIMYDKRSDALIAVVEDTAILKLDKDTFAVLDAYDSSSPGFNTQHCNLTRRLRINQLEVPGFIWTKFSDNLYRFDTYNMEMAEVITDLYQEVPGSSALGDLMYDYKLDCFWWATAGYTQLFRERYSTDAVTVADAVSDICEDCGMAPNEYDVSELEAIDLIGYTRTKPMSGRKAIEPLMTTFRFDAVESDHVLKFVRRGGSSARTIPARDLGASSGNEAGKSIKQERAQDKDLPKAITVNYASQKRNYRNASQRATRISETHGSDHEMHLQVPIVLDDQDAKDLSEVILNANWQERDSYELSVHPRHVAIDPTDIITFEKRGPNLDADIAMRVDETHVGDDGVVRLKGMEYSAPIYTPSVPAHQYDQVVDLIPILLSTKQFLWDGPVIPAIGNDDGGFWWVPVPESEAPGASWPGAILFGGLDTSSQGSFDDLADSDTHTTWFELVDPLPPLASLDAPWNSWNETQSFRVYVKNGRTLQSVSRLEALEGANLCVIKDEVIIFRDATLNGDGTYTLSGLLRGRLGTERAALENKQVGVQGFMIDRADMERIGNAEQIGKTYFLKSLTVGEEILSTYPRPFVPRGGALKPWAPCSVSGSRDGSDNLTIAWLRRTRFNGPWQNDTDAVPLNEETEAYEVDIMDGSTVVRTITGLSSPSATYSAADQTTDFGSTQSAVTVRVYQISATVGRGFYREVTV